MVYIEREEFLKTLIIRLAIDLPEHCYAIRDGVGLRITEVVDSKYSRDLELVYPQLRLMYALSFARSGLAGNWGLQWDYSGTRLEKQKKFYQTAADVSSTEMGRITFSGLVPPRAPHNEQEAAMKLNFMLTTHLGLFAISKAQLNGAVTAVSEYERWVDRVVANGAANQDNMLYRRAELNKAMAQRFGSGSGIDIVHLPLDDIITRVVKERDGLLQPPLSFSFEPHRFKGYRMPVQRVYSPLDRPESRVMEIDGIEAVLSPTVSSVSH